jgi:hypothetical protein
MRLPSARLLVPVLLLAAPMAMPATARAATTPVSVDAPAVKVSVYRVTLSSKHRADKLVHLILQSGERGVTGVLLDDTRELELTNVRIEGTALRATIETSEGAGELDLQVSDEKVVGTLRVGRDPMQVDGEHCM